jgi:EmrB/QacA subfamily drug resistance transporter
MTTQARSQAAAGARVDGALAGSAGRPPGWAPLLVMLTGTAMTYLDFFIVNVALPSIQHRLGAGPAAVQLVVAGFTLAVAVGLITAGRLGDLYGRRRVFTIGLAAFTVASAGCGLAPGPGFLVAARVVQGAAAALMAPQVLATLGTMYAGARRARAFAAYGLTMGIAGVAGQLIGGGLITLDVAGAGWRSIFLINVPVGAAAVALVPRLVPESRGPRDGVDLTGTALVTAALAAVVLPLVEGRQQGWPGWAWACLAVSPVLLAAFVAQQRARARAGRAPLVRLELFASRSFTAGTLAAVMFGGVPAAFFFVLALYLQEGRGLSPLVSGVVFTAVGAGYLSAMLASQRMAARLGRHTRGVPGGRPPGPAQLAVGGVVLAAGVLVLAALAGAPTVLALLPGLAAAGFGIGLVLVPLTATALAGVAPAHAGAASGVVTTGLQVGGCIGVALIGVVFYGALGSGGYAHAFAVSLAALAGLAVATAAVVQLLPRRSA